MNTQSIQEVAPLQNAMQAAVLSANAVVEKKLSDTKQGVPMIVPRVDLLGNRILVLADSLDPEKDTIQYYDLKKGKMPQTVSAAYYRSTKKIEDVSEVAKLVQDFSKLTGNKEIILRERLLKESSRRVADPEKLGDDVAANKEFADKLVRAISNAIYKALAVEK